MLTRQEVLEIEKVTSCAHPLRTTEEESVWIAPRKDGKGLYLALFNLTDKKRAITVRTEDAELPSLTGRELWTGKNARKAKQLRTVLAAHDAAVWHVI